MTAALGASGPQRALDPVWLVRLRWAAIAAQLASVAGTRYLLRAPFPFAPLAAIIAALALANVWLSYSLRRGHRPTPGAITAQLLLDVAALTGLLVWTGGAMNPFTTLYLLHVALAAILVPRRHSLAVTLGAALAFGGLLLARPEAIHVWHSAGMFLLHVRGMWIAFALTALCLWYFVERVSEALQARERELSRARTEAERAERMVALGTLAAGAAHELNNPLGTMAILASELAEVLPAKSEERARADAIRAEVKRCSAILSRLRARADEGTPRERIELVAWLRACIEESSVETAAAKIDAPTELWAHGYRDELTQALGVLIDNARRAAPSEPVEFTLARDDDKHLVRVRVRDRGEGVDPTHLQRLGDPFFTTRAPGEGMGLGLFFARAVAARHGGGLTFEAADPGTAVTLELPLDSPESESAR